MRLLIFDPDHNGHHAGYLLNLLRYLKDSPTARSNICLAVSDDYLNLHRDVIDYANKHFPKLDLYPLEDTEVRSILNAHSPAVRGLREAFTLRKAIHKYGPDKILCMYLDYMLLPLSMGWLARQDVSGIVFRLNPHYPRMFGTKFSFSESVKSRLRGFILKRALLNPALKGCLCLDRYLYQWIKKSSTQENIYHCPDPVYLPHGPALSATAGNSSRKTLLLFGMVSRRKGAARFLQVLEAIDSQYLNQLRIRIVGPTGEKAEESSIRNLSRKLRLKGAEIERVNKFIPDEEIQPYFDNCDGVVTPYIRHIGMSAIQVRAAAAGKPNLSTDYGLMGALARKYRLGMTFNMNDANSIKFAIYNFLLGQYHFDETRVRRFASENTPEAFGSAVCRAIRVETHEDPIQGRIQKMS